MFLLPSNRALLAFFSLAAVAFAGCSGEAVVSPSSPVILEPETEDFGLTGRWTPLPSPNEPMDPFDGEPTVIAVTMGEDGSYKVHPDDEQVITLRTTHLNNDLSYAIVEIEIASPDDVECIHNCRLLAVTKRQNDRLYLWWINAEKLAKALRQDGHSGVFVKGVFITEVDAEPEELLDTIRKHSGELVGEPSQLRLVNK